MSTEDLERQMEGRAMAIAICYREFSRHTFNFEIYVCTRRRKGREEKKEARDEERREKGGREEREERGRDGENFFFFVTMTLP
jgi:hypothetical protein